MKIITSIKAALIMCLLCNGAVLAFSDEYEPYYPHITAVTRSVDEIYNRTVHPDTVLSEDIIKARKDIIQMYKDFGLDVSYNIEDITGPKLVANVPQRWSPKTPRPIDASDASLAFSVDAAWHNKIPEDAPRVQIPIDGYGKNIQISMVKSNRQNTDADGIGIPLIAGGKDDPYQTIVIKDYRDTEQYYGYYRMRLPEGIVNYVNNTQISDEHALFMDTQNNIGLEVWLCRAKGDPRGYATSQEGYLPSADIRGCSAGFIYKLGGIAAEGRSGCDAAGLPMTAFTIKPSEVKEKDRLIEHAIGGCMNRMWGARVFPAYFMDSHMVEEDGSPANSIYAGSCVPYGGVIQLDPEIDLEKLVEDKKLSWPGYKVLKAWQDYGFYNIDCAGFETTMIYSSTNGTDWTNPDDPDYNVPFMGGVQSGSAVSQEVKAFIQGNEFFGVGIPKLFVTTPVVKMAELDVNGDGNIDKADYEAVMKANGSEYNDSTKIYDVNQDKTINANDTEIMYRYLNDLPMHDFVYYSAVERDNDSEHGQIMSCGGLSREVNGVKQFRKDAIVQFTAFPNDGYEFDCWTGDFAKYKDATVQVTMDKEYVFGAKYRKIKEDYGLTVKTVGGGHVEVHTDKNLTYGAPEERYTKNTLLAFNAVPDEGWVFAGWRGAVEGFNSPAYKLVEGDLEVTAVFVQEIYNDSFKKENWRTVDGEIETKDYTVTEDTGIFIAYDSFSLPELLSINHNEEIDLTGDYIYRVYVSAVGRINNPMELVFNYKDKNNYYYFTIGGLGTNATLGKKYKGYKTTLAKYTGKIEIDGISFDGTPMYIEITRKDGAFTACGYKNGGKITYFENIKDKTHDGGKIGVGSVNNGILEFKKVQVQKEVPDLSGAVIQN